MGSAIRFTGLSSGLDTQSVVEALLTSYQSKIDKQKANKQKAEWKQEIYTDLNKKLKSFKNSMEELKEASNLCTAKTTTSKEGILSVKHADYTGDENYSILVAQVADKASVYTLSMDSYTDSNGNTSKVTSKSKLDDIFSGDADARKAIIKIGNATVKLEECTTIEDIVNSVKSQDSNIKINFNDSISAFTISSVGIGKNQKIDIKMGTEQADGSIAISDVAEGTGAASALKKMRIGYYETLEGSNVAMKFKGHYEGKNAVIEYNNSLVFESETNDIEIDGLSFTVQAESTEAIKVSVTQDTSQAYDKVKKFVESYNTLLEEITTKYYADSAAKYDVLTDDEKEAMSEKEVEIWNDKIKGALLRRDSNLEALYSGMRSVMTTDYSKAENGGLDTAFGLLSQIGISSTNWSDRGKLTINEDKLKSLLSTDGDKVSKLISQVATSLEDKLVKLSSTTSDERSYGSFFNDKLIKNQIKQFEDEADKAQSKYDTMETYYYKKFTAMEKAMQSLNSTSSLFANM